MRILNTLLVGILLGASVVYLMLSVFAETAISRPNGDGTSSVGAAGCEGGSYYTCLDEVVTEPDSVTTGSDFIQIANTEDLFILMDNTIEDIDTVTSITVWAHRRDAGTNAFPTIGLYAANETTVYASPTSLGTQTSAGWDSITFGGLSLTQAQMDGLRLKIDCEKSGGGKSNDCFFYALYAEVTFDPAIEVTVGSAGTQANLSPDDVGVHVGGSFAITENSATRDVTDVTITENGTINAANDLDNIELYYEFDTSVPYNCASESYAGTETQFGATDTDGFSGADGTSTFTNSGAAITITTTSALCLYPVLDVASTSIAGQTIELEIDDPTTDITVTNVTNLDIEPSTSVLLPGTTIIQAPSVEQLHYHWRNDDGSESGASSATGGSEDTTLDTLAKESEIRLRFGISNEGNATSDPIQYRLEYAPKVSTCEDATGWTDVGAGGGDWNMFNSSNLTDGNNTTNVAVASGGVSNENITFLSTNGAVKDTSSQTGNITLTSSEYVDLEYSIVSTASANEGNTYCFRVTDAGTEIDVYNVYPETTILADVNVTTLDSQTATVDIPTSDIFVGSTFVLTDNIAGDTTVQGITITASGTVDLQNDVNNIELRYDLDTSNPYDCQSESFDITDTQFGATDTDGFSVSDTSAFTGSQIINPTQTMCLYVVYDIDSDVTNDEAIDIKIQNASTDVTIDTGNASPNALVDLPGTTFFVTNILSTVHYHWREDDGSETGASSATGGSEDTLQENLRRTIPTRLRIGIANEGSSTTVAYQYRLEYALKTSVCSAASGWEDVNAADDEFNLFNSVNITDGDDTTDIAVSTGGVTDVGSTFFSNNNGVKDTSSQVSSFALPGDSYTDLEFSLTASTSATEGATYCFRLTDAGTPFPASFYSVYPEVSIKPRTDYFIQRGVTDVSGTSGSIVAGTDYVAPSAASTAFIRIVGTNNTGAGSASNSGNADDVTVYISNPSNITSGITFTRPGTAVDSTRVHWEIIEYVGAPGGDNEMIVRQQQSATYGTGATTVTTGAVGSIADDNDVAVFITGQLNPDVATNYPLGVSTAAWNAGADTATFTRGGSGNAAILSYAVVEFVGDNWRVQRAENTYAAAGSAETQAITAVNSLTRTFLHAQKRMASGLTNHSDFGHNVYFSGIGQVTFELESGASTPASHTSVAWIIENVQTIGDSMRVSRSNGSETGGASPKTITNSIGVTISDTQDASLFINNHGDEVNGTSNANSFPEPILGAQITTETQYQTWVGDPDQDTRTWRAEVVEWPTAARDIAQNYYRFYVDNDALDPTDPWPAGGTDLGENTEVTVNDDPIANGSTTRLRMTLSISAASMDPGIDTFKLQYGERTSTCSAIIEDDWFDLGDSSSTTALWRGASATPVDGTALSTDPPAVGALNISVSDVAGTYEEENPSALTPFNVDPGEDVEFDWAIEHNGAKDKTTYCFRMLEADGDLFDAYNFYPAIRTVGYEPLLSNWRWYDDETSLTPSSPLASENVAPVDVVNQNAIKLRVSVQEVSGAPGTDIKFALQYSEYSDFSQSVATVTATTSCTGNSLWCFFDGNGVDNEQVDGVVISDTDSCVSGVGVGCGTHNEGVGTTSATFDHPPFSTTEYEYTLVHDGARANAVYYFRLYDVVNNQIVPLDTGSSYPSLITQGAQLVFSVAGLDAGTTIAGQVTDATTTATGIGFGSLTIGESAEAAQRLTVNTNATEGYQLLMYSTQQLTNNNGDVIPDITGSNATPTGWGSACDTTVVTGCFGYHTTDATLANSSGRFAPIDSYAAFSVTPEEVMYSSIPVVDTQDILYRVEASLTQPIGDYTTDIVYIVVPVF